MSKSIFKGIAAVAIVAAVAFVCYSQDRSHRVDYPTIDFANTDIIDVAAVELSDSNTVVHIKATYLPKYWIQISGNTYLMADGVKYAMTSTNGIKPDIRFWMPESGQADFELIFEPMPLTTEKFSLIEDIESDGFRLEDINISDKPSDKYPAQLPEELKDESLPNELLEPLFEMGLTTIRFHMLPYRKDWADNFNLYINTIAGNQEELPVKFDDNGIATVRFGQYGTAEAYLVYNNRNSICSLTLKPGETIDAYIDMRRTGYLTMQHRGEMMSSPYLMTLHNGYYRGNDLVMASIYDKNISFMPQLYNGEFADYHLNGQQYKEMLKKVYTSTLDSINSNFKEPVQREYLTLKLKNFILEAAKDYQNLQALNYRHMANDWKTPAPADSLKAHITDEDFADIAGWFEINNPKLLLGNEAIGMMDWNNHGVPGDLSRSITLFGRATQKAKKMILEEADLDTLRTLSNPFFAIAIDSLAQRTKREYELMRSKVSITPTPDVPDDQIFDSIVAQYKGKVVVIDLWNTWCGPCRFALKYHEPLKESGALAFDDIVWVYIADQSSDLPKYMSMLPDIKGVHYYLTEKQIDIIRKRFDVDGIPYYILVDRNGNAQGRPDIHDTSKYVKSIQSLM